MQFMGYGGQRKRAVFLWVLSYNGSQNNAISLQPGCKWRFALQVLPRKCRNKTPYHFSSQFTCP